MKKIILFIVGLLSLGATIEAQDIPQEVWGTWVVRREIPTRTVSCWSEARSRALIGTEIQYSNRLFRWKRVVIETPSADVRIVSAKEFHDYNSGGGANDSQVTFEQLGIRAEKAKQISINHPDANITGATIEIPGDRLLVKSPDSIVFSVCNVYFEARRIIAKESPTMN